MGAPYVASKNKIIKEILEKAKLKKNKYFIELGSGDGRVVRNAVKNYQVIGLGIEINPLLVNLSKILAKFDKIKIDFQRKNIYHVNLEKADYLYLFLMPEMIVKLINKFNKELKKKTLVISHGFKIPGWEKKLVNQLNNKPFPTYFYIK